MEDLLILHRESVVDLRAAITGRGLRIMQQASPRVVLVEGDAENFATAIREQGVLSVTESLSGQGEPALKETNLTATESLFVRAWIHRQATPDKKRPADGLDWDAPGFSAP